MYNFAGAYMYLTVGCVCLMIKSRVVIVLIAGKKYWSARGGRGGYFKKEGGG